MPIFANSRACGISETELEDLVSIITEAQRALDDLAAGNYRYDEANDAYIQNDMDELYSAWRDAYLKFSDWLAR